LLWSFSLTMLCQSLFPHLLCCCVSSAVPGVADVGLLLQLLLLLRLSWLLLLWYGCCPLQWLCF
jgi:hypothetical protein